MCLTLNPSLTKKYASRKTPITVYKAYGLQNEVLTCLYRHGSPLISKTGVIKSNRKSTKIAKDEEGYDYINIEKGIHVYLTKPEIGDFHTQIQDIVILKGTANPKDLIGTHLYNTQRMRDGKITKLKIKTAAFLKITVDPVVIKQYPYNVKQNVASKTSTPKKQKTTKKPPAKKRKTSTKKN